MTCDDRSARVAFAISDPGTREAPLSHERAPLPAEPGRHHVVVVATCDASGCTRREGVARGVEAGWHSQGGFSSPMAMSTPMVAAMGERVVLVWQEARALRYRMGPLDHLESGPSPWIAEIARPQPDSEREERRLAWPASEIVVRGGVALLLVTESRGPWAGFLVRIDQAGDALALAPPEPPPE